MKKGLPEFFGLIGVAFLTGCSYLIYLKYESGYLKAFGVYAPYDLINRHLHYPLNILHSI